MRPSAHDSSARILSAAAIIMVGQLLSSILGMVRIEVLNILFYGVASGAFIFALRPTQQLNDLLIGSAVSGALIPTLVDYTSGARKAELRRVFSTLVNLVLLIMAVAVIVIYVAAPAFIPFEAAKFTPAGQQLTVTLTRIAAFSLVGLGVFAVCSALLYAAKKVVYPAFATGVYHVGVVVCGILVLLGAARVVGVPIGDVLHANGTSTGAEAARLLGSRGLAVGAVLGAVGEVALLFPGLRRLGAVWRPILDLRHPAVRQILRLYAPVAAGMVLSIAQQNVESYLIGRTPGGAAANTTALQSATTLVQFPVGLVAAALSFAVLPPLAAAASRGAMVEFKRTLALGFRFGLLLMIPATVGLILLRVPIVELLFQHGACGHDCTVRNALALQNYAYQLPFLAVDQLLIAAFYARKNTLVPVLVGVVSIAFWLAVALPFAGTIGMPAIAFANTALNSGHALILLVLLTLSIGSLGMRDLLPGLARILVASAGLGLVCAGLLWLLPRVLPSVFASTHFGAELLTVLVIGGAGTLTYFGLAVLLRIPEVSLLRAILASKFGMSRLRGAKRHD